MKHCYPGAGVSEFAEFGGSVGPPFIEAPTAPAPTPTHGPFGGSVGPPFIEARHGMDTRGAARRSGGQ